MPGFSITLLLLPTKDEVNAPSLEDLLEFLDDQPEVPGWKWSSGKPPSTSPKHSTGAKEAQLKRDEIGSIRVPDPENFVNSIKRAARALIDAEAEITKMDFVAGDGDCGLTLKVKLDVTILG